MVAASVALRQATRRYSSSVASIPKKNKVPNDLHLKTTLPDAKLRLLISLHHQADTFITPANLDTVITNQFAPEDIPIYDELVRYYSIDDARSRLSSLRETPRLRDYTLLAAAGYNDHHDAARARDRQIKSALFGTERESPGLEVLREFPVVEIDESEEKPLETRFGGRHDRSRNAKDRS